MRNAFKNFRRNRIPDDDSRSPSQCRKPPEKRRRYTDISDGDAGTVSIEKYDEDVAVLKLEWKKGRKQRSHAVLKELMNETATQRNKWIIEEKPLISEVIRKFPPLKESRMVS